MAFVAALQSSAKTPRHLTQIHAKDPRLTGGFELDFTEISTFIFHKLHKAYTPQYFPVSEMSTCIGDVSITSVSLSDITSSSSVSDKFWVHWGCELSAAKTTAVFEAENDLLENQFFIKTICLSAEAGDEMHVVAVSDGVGGSKPVPIATLRHCMPMVSFPGLELIPPVTFRLCSGKGPVFISGQHITLNPAEITGHEEEAQGNEDNSLTG